MDVFGKYYRLSVEIARMISKEDISISEYVSDDGTLRDESCFLDINKSWQVIHFILTSRQDESESNCILSKVVLSNNFISKEDLGFGPAMIVFEDEVKEISRLLKDISKNDFKTLFDFQLLVRKEIYPVNKTTDQFDFFDCLWKNFSSLKSFYRKASANKQCVVFFLSSS